MSSTTSRPATGPNPEIERISPPIEESVPPAAVEQPLSGEDLEHRRTARRNSVAGLVRDLGQEIKTLIRQEIKLAKAELSEKLHLVTRNGVALAIGGTIAYAGVIVLLLGFGFLIALAIHLAGVEGLFASFLGLIFVGFVTIGTGGALVLKGMFALREQSLAPERTISTLKDLKGTKTKAGGDFAPARPPEPKVSSREMQGRVEATEAEMGETLDELTHRLAPRRLNAKVKRRIRERPFKAGLIAMGAGLVSGLLLKGRSRNSA
ncbi:MAG: phage holin family protein [Limisphaerales bacterium]